MSENGQQMNEIIVKTENLTKTYGKHIVAVDHLNMNVRRGEVYGFLGPNGAGKTTTLRMLFGLIRPTSGSGEVRGEPLGNSAGITKAGGLIEGPAFYPYLSGRRNLIIMAKYSGVSRSRVGEVLKQVELTSRADDKFKTYSLGMKQRLGVAAALLKDPELLILDEPTNGLDPKGMAEIRTLIRKLGQEDRTVLLSSHLLGEVEQICDRVGVIQQGKLVAEGAVAELRGQSGLLVRANPVEAALPLLRKMGGIEEVHEEDGALQITADPSLAGDIARVLVKNDIDVTELRPLERSLEDIFMELTEGSSVSMNQGGLA